MRRRHSLILTGIALAMNGTLASAQGVALAGDTAFDPIREMVGRLELAKYKATIKGLTQFGDRRQGTKRNRDALDWIEAQLKSYGCTNTERITYTYPPPTVASAGRGAGGGGAGGRGGAGGGGRAGAPQGDTLPLGGLQAGGWRFRGIRGRTGVNNDSLLQPDARLRALNAEPTSPGERQNVYCTKVGSTRPDEMYIVGAHMDGHGWGEAVNDDGSGTALVMELARVFSSPDVKPIVRSGSSSGTTRRRGSTVRRRTSISARRCRAKNNRRVPANTPSRNGSA